MTSFLSSYLYKSEAKCVEELRGAYPLAEAAKERVALQASQLIAKARKARGPRGQLESFLQQYSLTSDEGLALMCLAEALLRIPDSKTADALIRDKVVAANWLKDIGNSKDWVVKAAGVGLLMTTHTLDSVLARVGEPFIRNAMVQAMRIMGGQFVLGRTIKEAMKNAKKEEGKGYRFSYDMLGEAARTKDDAERYYQNYEDTLRTIAAHREEKNKPYPGISVKLSALHPRYEFAQKENCVPALTEKLLALAEHAQKADIALTVDAEEVDRLELSLEIIRNVLEAESFSQGWHGFGMAVQAYQKRCLPLIDYIGDMALARRQRLQVRLVKGAYWDTEIKHAQLLGLPDYAVFTRKAHTDLSYIVCAARLFEFKDQIFPMFGTHNAYTISAIIDLARQINAPFELQRLHGMGQTLYKAVRESFDIPVSVYAPVGPHEDLLPYLVRRLLENGANSSFVNKIMDPTIAIEDLTKGPDDIASGFTQAMHPKIPLPENLYQAEAPQGRKNSRGLDFNDDETVKTLAKEISLFFRPYDITPVIGGKQLKPGVAEENKNPGDDGDNLGLVWFANKKLADQAVQQANKAFTKWNATPANERARILENYADLLEANRAELMALCIREAGKAWGDSLAEIREAVDFCRYYANRGRKEFDESGELMPGPTGEDNIYKLEGRGVFLCISPWNFPLAIFTGQVSAALMAGNTVVAKPAEQTPAIAFRAVQLMHEAGVPAEALQLVTGAGEIGAHLTNHPLIAGVAFTGSEETAKSINRTLAEKDGPIIPFIAETGGMNAMIVDSSALPEQVIDDVITSAFGSAGQRCSALRILCVQEDIADKICSMLAGAMQELCIGKPVSLASDIGPVIDEEAYAQLARHRQQLEGHARFIADTPLDEAVKSRGRYFAPCAFELDSLKALNKEVFGPILHIVRYKKEELPELIEELNAKGYGLTFGVHSRIDNFYNDLIRKVHAGNAYINRSMIGAVVGVQPFGGHGLSGTGPKAGGPYYLARFATEKAISIDTTASGGNASLVSIDD